jgi:hypothetical protein
VTLEASILWLEGNLKALAYASHVADTTVANAFTNATLDWYTLVVSSLQVLIAASLSSAIRKRLGVAIDWFD